MGGVVPADEVTGETPHASPAAPPAAPPEPGVITEPPATPGLPWRSTTAAILLGAGGWIGGRVLAGRPELAESLLAGGPHPALVRAMTTSTGASPVPVAELLVLVLLAWVAFLPWRRRPGAAGLRLLRGAALLFLAFQLLWGVQYARPSLEDRLGMPSAGQVPESELVALATALVERTNALYLELHGSPDAGSPTPAPIRAGPMGPARTALDASWAEVVRRWGLPAAMGAPRAAPRYALSTPLLRWTGISGVFVPWTGEGLVLSDLAGAAVPHTLAHESAHQRGVARESDANALAYLLSLESPDPAARYAGALFLQRQALQALARRDSEATLRLVEARHPGVQRDVEAMIARAIEVEGPLRRAASRANDAMLRGHGVSEGIESYAGSLWIVVALARDRGLEALLP